jgi:hypothetical protein
MKISLSLIWDILVIVVLAVVGALAHSSFWNLIRGG